jgi:hypothetical protein
MTATIARAELFGKQALAAFMDDRKIRAVA